MLYTMSSSFLFALSLPLFGTIFVISISPAHAIVPCNATFKYVNEGELGGYIVEYGADYRPLDIGKFPFLLCFYNTTPNNFLLESDTPWAYEFQFQSTMNIENLSSGGGSSIISHLCYSLDVSCSMWMENGKLHTCFLTGMGV